MSNAPIRSEFSRAEHAQLLARVAALEELLSVHEEVVLEQSKHLEGALAELRDFNAELEAHVSERTLELSEANRILRERFERERLMLAINNAVVSELSLRELFRVISAKTREVLGNDTTSMAIYDAETNQLRAYVFDHPDNKLPVIDEGTPIPLEGSLGGKAFTTGQPVFVQRNARERTSTEFDRRLVDAGIKSGGCVPLIAQDRKLGVMGVGSFREDAFSEADQELLGHIANQIALAVENALNFERALKAEQESRRQFERLRLMLDVNNATVTQLDLRELVRIVSSCLRETLQYDIVGLSLYHADTNQLRAYAYDFPDKQFAIPEGTPIPLQGSMGGRVFTSGRALFFNRPDTTRAVSPFNQRFVDVGVKSGGGVPLIAYGRKLGVLGVASFREDAFPPTDQELLGQIANQIALAVKNALDYQEIESLKNKLTEEKLYLEEEINTAYNFEEIIGSSAVLRRILKQVETVAPTDSTVLIVGETGTGKELIARAIHNLSVRRDRTLVKLNCAAIPSGLLESELFGHERGAFTGAIAQRIGRFELAHKGTLFLDEVGEIPLDLQPKLLRVLQEQEFERLGNARTQKVDVRLIAATNRDLAAMSAENKYRSDLYYRLNVFPLTIPPLRERQDDIPLLARFFANKFAVRMKKQIKTIPAEVVAALQGYHWPGNIRELENLIERAVILTQGTELHIPLPEIPALVKTAVAVAPAAPISTPLSSADSASLEAVEREHILRILRETKWVVGGPTGAAARLGMKRTTLQNRMTKLGITRPG